MNDAALQLTIATEPRTFKTVKGALMWFRNEQSRRHGQAQNLEGSRVRRGRAELERDRLTYGLLASCMVPAPPNDQNDPLKAEPLGHLVQWMLEFRKTSLADELGLSEHVMSKKMGRLEGALARRMRRHGLLADFDL